MPYCPNCLEEYDDGMTACVMCGSDLIDGTPPGNTDPDLGDMEPVFVGPLAKALPIKSALEDEGLSVFLAGDDEIHVSSEAIAGPQTMVKIMVPSEAATSAARIVDQTAGELEEGCTGENEGIGALAGALLGMDAEADPGPDGELCMSADAQGEEPAEPADKLAFEAPAPDPVKKTVASSRPAKAKAKRPTKPAKPAKPAKSGDKAKSAGRGRKKAATGSAKSASRGSAKAAPKKKAKAVKPGKKAVAVKKKATRPAKPARKTARKR